MLENVHTSHAWRNIPEESARRRFLEDTARDHREVARRAHNAWLQYDCSRSRKSKQAATRKCFSMYSLLALAGSRVNGVTDNKVPRNEFPNLLEQGFVILLAFISVVARLRVRSCEWSGTRSLGPPAYPKTRRAVIDDIEPEPMPAWYCGDSSRPPPVAYSGACSPTGDHFARRERVLRRADSALLVRTRSHRDPPHMRRRAVTNGAKTSTPRPLATPRDRAFELRARNRDFGYNVALARHFALAVHRSCAKSRIVLTDVQTPRTRHRAPGPKLRHVRQVNTAQRIARLKSKTAASIDNRPSIFERTTEYLRARPPHRVPAAG